MKGLCPRCGAPVAIGVDAGYEFNEWAVRCSAKPHDHSIEMSEYFEDVPVAPLNRAEDAEKASSTKDTQLRIAKDAPIQLGPTSLEGDRTERNARGVWLAADFEADLGNKDGHLRAWKTAYYALSDAASAVLDAAGTKDEQYAIAVLGKTLIENGRSGRKP